MEKRRRNSNEEERGTNRRSRLSSASRSFPASNGVQEDEKDAWEDAPIVIFQANNTQPQNGRATEFWAELKDRSRSDWRELPQDKQKAAIVNTVRFLVFAGTQGRAVELKHEIIGVKRMKRAVLGKAQQELRRSFGLEISSTKSFEDINQSSTEKLFVYNGLQNPALRLQRPRPTMGSAGPKKAFAWLVFQSICASNGHKITLKQLLSNLRELDSRVPQQVSWKTPSKTADIEELGMSIAHLLIDLENEGYVVFTRHECEDDDSKGTLSFGQRFLLEIGVEQIQQGYSEGLGESRGRIATRQALEDEHKQEAVTVAEI